MSNSEQVKSMLCPVCGEFYFSELSQDELDEGVSPNSIQCTHCGWFYDLDQLTDNNLANKTNTLCLLDYKNQYMEKVSLNPKYDYLEENQQKPEAHLCPVCGEHKFKDTSSFEVCPICGWEDDGFVDGDGANNMSLSEYIKDFKKKREVNPGFVWVKFGNK